MIAPLALLLTMAQPEVPGRFEHGVWYGRCYRNGHLGGYDHERCNIDQKDFGEIGRLVIDLERTAEGLFVHAWTNGCRSDGSRAVLAAAVLDGPERVEIATAYLREQIRRQVRACGSSVPIPVIPRSDVAALLRATDGLAPGNFLQLDPVERAPAAAACGRQLATAWRAEMLRHPPTTVGRVNLTMYTLSEGGSGRAEGRFDAVPEMMADLIAFGTGPGGMVIFARKPAQAWRDAPDAWFATLCDIAIEAWSGFVELAAFPEDDGRDGDTIVYGGTPTFAVRASTGVAGIEGYAISAAPIVPQPRGEPVDEASEDKSSSVKPVDLGE